MGAKSKNRGGRPRKQNVKREPNGRASRSADRGTVELQAKRAILVGGGDPAKASYPLGVLHATGSINDGQLRAGERYAWLYRIVVGKMSIAAVRYDETQGGIAGRDRPHRWTQDRKREFEHAAASLEIWLAKKEIDALTVFQRLPAAALPGLPTSDGLKEAERIRRGLDLLSVLFGMDEPGTIGSDRMQRACIALGRGKERARRNAPQDRTCVDDSV